MITVRATTVESFRLYSDPDFDFISAEEMESRLRGIETDVSDEARARMDRGTAFHAAVEGAAIFDDVVADDDVTVEVDGYTFAASAIVRARVGLRDAVPEVEGSTIVDVDGVPVQLTGHADWLRGLDMVEFKTSDKPIPADRHAESMQWRIYCLIFGVERITYRHVQLASDRAGVLYARAMDDVVLYRYPKLRSDIVMCLRGLLAFASVRGCLDAMRINGRAA